MDLLDIYHEHKEKLEQEIRSMYAGLQNSGLTTAGDFVNRIAHLEKLMADINIKIAGQATHIVEINNEANGPTKVIKLFLASSQELKRDREEFEIFINRRNKTLLDQGMFLHLVIWEDFIDAVSETRLQDEYNKAIARCDLFISLFHTKVGPYTNEEFETALENFHAHHKPLIYTYFKDLGPGTVQEASLTDFKNRLRVLGHFPTSYNSIADLKLHFLTQIEKLLPSLS